MSLRKRLAAFLGVSASKHAVGSQRESETRLVASPLYCASAQSPDYALVLQHWTYYKTNLDADLTWPKFLRLLHERHSFYTAERQDREVELARQQARIEPLP